jgi:hypothetical protein
MAEESSKPRRKVGPFTKIVACTLIGAAGGAIAPDLAKSDDVTAKEGATGGAVAGAAFGLYVATRRTRGPRVPTPIDEHYRQGIEDEYWRRRQRENLHRQYDDHDNPHDKGDDPLGR